MREFPRVYPGTGMPGITPRHGKNRPHGECEIGGSCEKSHEPTTRSSRLWPPIWPCYSVPEGRVCVGDMGAVASALRYEAADLQQPDRRSCGHGRRDLAIRGRGGDRIRGHIPEKMASRNAVCDEPTRATAGHDCTRRAIARSACPRYRGQPTGRWSRPNSRRYPPVYGLWFMV